MDLSDGESSPSSSASSSPSSSSSSSSSLREEDDRMETETTTNNNSEQLINQQPQQPKILDENDETTRFQIELEFVQSLANPNYLNYLAQRGYFKQPTFLNYLRYLMYWKEPEYCKHLVYPQCLRLLEMLQHEKFLTELVNAQCTRFVDDQLIRVWLQYKKKHDWIRYDPAKIPENVTKLFQKSGETSIEDTTKSPPAVETEDPFSAHSFIKNEKF